MITCLYILVSFMKANVHWSKNNNYNEVTRTPRRLCSKGLGWRLTQNSEVTKSWWPKTMWPSDQSSQESNYQWGQAIITIHNQVTKWPSSRYKRTGWEKCSKKSKTTSKMGARTVKYIWTMLEYIKTTIFLVKCLKVVANWFLFIVPSTIVFGTQI